MKAVITGLLILVGHFGCGSGSSSSELLDATSSCITNNPGYYCNSSGAPVTFLAAGKCNLASDCPPPYNQCNSSNQCVINPASSASAQIWFATDPIRPGVTATCNDKNGDSSCPSGNTNDFVYNIMAKGYASLDDWCMSQAQQSTDPNVRNKSAWTALIVANGPETSSCGSPPVCPLIASRLAPAFLNRVDSRANFNGSVWQQSPNGYKNPDPGSCSDNICDKNGNAIHATWFNKNNGFVNVSLAWFGYDRQCVQSQYHTELQPGYDSGGCSMTEVNTVAAPTGCLAPTGVDTNQNFNQEYTAGGPFGQFWSKYSVSFGGSLYVSNKNLSTSVCVRAICNNPYANANCGLVTTDPYPTYVTSQNRIICLSVD
jgi:hypothetical protein